MTQAADRLIVALDCASTDENVALVRTLRGRARWFKVGLREFYGDRATVIDAVRDADARLFLDLKLHDVPSTVAGAVRALADLRPELLTIHAAGGTEMLRAARKAAPAETQLLGVTVLTSLGVTDTAALGLDAAPGEIVARWASLAIDAGADGLVCSGEEVAALRARHPDALLVTPGIRPVGAEAGDQKRVVTPGAAIGSGATHLVVGRPIYGAAIPAAAFEAVVAEIEAAIERQPSRGGS